MIEVYKSSALNKKEMYHQLLDYLLSKCDSFSFCVPNYEARIKFDNWDEAKAQYIKQRHTLNRNNDKFIEYHKQIGNLLDSLKKYEIGHYFDVDYIEQTYSYEIEAFVYKYNSETCEILKTVPGLFDWLYPLFPEDISFFTKEQCYLQTITHEEVGFIYDDNCDFFEETNVATLHSANYSIKTKFEHNAEGVIIVLEKLLDNGDWREYRG